MAGNRVKVSICGADYYIIAEDNAEYIRDIAREVERGMEEAMQGNARISLTMAAVLTAMDCCDRQIKAAANADNLRTQVREYLADSARSRSEAEESRREIGRLTQEVALLRRRIEELENAGEPEEAPAPAPEEFATQTHFDLPDAPRPPRAKGEPLPRPKEISAGEFLSLFDTLGKKRGEK